MTAAGLLVIGLAWGVQGQFGVTEIHRKHSARDFPLALASASADDWPGVRGPLHQGESPRDAFPRAIGPSSQWTWQVDLPGVPLAGPCVRGDRVLVPVIEPDLAAISLWAMNRGDGRLAWKTVLHAPLKLNPALLRGTATPACDGQAVFLGAVVNGRLQVSAVDLHGRLLWITDAGPMRCENGRLVSPLLHDELVIVSAEHRGTRAVDWMPSSHLTALHRQTGEVLWRIRRPNGNHVVTPALANIDGGVQLILAAPGEVSAYDPANGELRWSCRWEATRVAGSVAWDHRHVYVAAREPRSLVMAIRAEGTGDVTASHIAWRSEAAIVSSNAPVCATDSILVLNDDGLLTSLDRSTGKFQWKKHLIGSFLTGPLRAGNELLCLNTQGAAFVVDLAQRGKIAAELSIGNGVVAHPAAPRRQLILRTRSGLISLPWDSQESPIVNTPDRPSQRL